MFADRTPTFEVESYFRQTLGSKKRLSLEWLQKNAYIAEFNSSTNNIPRGLCRVVCTQILILSVQVKGDVSKCTKAIRLNVIKKNNLP